VNSDAVSAREMFCEVRNGHSHTCVLCWCHPHHYNNVALFVQYFLFANDLIKASELNVDAMFGTTESFSLAVTSYAVDNNLTWPFVTMPDWELKTNQARRTTGLETICLTPIVADDQTKEWETYSQEHTQWLKQGLQIQGRSPSPQSPEISPEIYRLVIEGSPPDYHLPVHQIGPAPDILSIVNMDIIAYSTFQRAVQDSMEERTALLSEITSVEDFYERAYTWYKGDILEDYGAGIDSEQRKLYTEIDQKVEEKYVPHSYIMQPVFETFDKDAKIVALIIGIIPWQKYFQNLLPDGVNGFVIDVKDSCGAEITYLINGEDAILLGVGDLHDPSYDYLKVSHTFAKFGGVDAIAHELDAALQDHFHDHCYYVFDVYPSAQLENGYLSNKPAIYTSVVVLVFFFTAMVFIMYDYLVTRRQSLVLTAAARTQALVSSLFPKSVQQRILEDANEHALNEQRINRTYGFRAKSQLKEFLEDDAEHAAHSMPLFNTRPIADLFPVSLSRVRWRI
jgi:hypothetical protein